MKKIIYLLVLFACQFTIAQQQANDATKGEDNNIYNSAGIEIKPEYPGGIYEFYSFVSKNYKVPEFADLKGGKIFVGFVIEKDGSLTDIKVLRDIGFGTGAEAVRVLKLSEKWKPAMQDGKPVRCAYQLPINISPK